MISITITKLQILGLSLGLALLLGACNTTTLLQSSNSSPDLLPVESNTTRSVVMGYFEVGDVNVARCPEGNLSRIRIQRGFLDSVIHILVGGIYSTRTQEVYCE